jgi:hypothetical protein
MVRGVGRALFGVMRATDGQQREHRSLALQQETEDLKAAFRVRGLRVLQLWFDDLEAARERHAEATADCGLGIARIADRAQRHEGIGGPILGRCDRSLGVADDVDAGQFGGG